MNRLLLLLTAGFVFAGALPATAADDPQGCVAVDPGQPRCSYTAASSTSEGGAVGSGAWKVQIKRGRKTITYSASGYYGEPSAYEFTIKKGDRVTAFASTGFVAVGGG